MEAQDNQPTRPIAAYACYGGAILYQQPDDGQMPVPGGPTQGVILPRMHIDVPAALEEQPDDPFMAALCRTPQGVILPRLHVSAPLQQ